MRAARIALPLLTQLPLPFVSTLLKLFMPDALGASAKLVFGQIVDYTRALRERRSNSTIIVVGHSLGGGMAAIVSASVHGVSGFGLSPSGVAYNSALFGIEPGYVYESFTAIVPDFDPIPVQGDRVIGLVQQVHCTSTAMGCHSAERTLATLAMACPDVSNPRRVWHIATPEVKYLTKNGSIEWPWQWKYKPEDYAYKVDPFLVGMPSSHLSKEELVD
jgi:hypothetical protein